MGMWTDANHWAVVGFNEAILNRSILPLEEEKPYALVANALKDILSFRSRFCDGGTVVNGRTESYANQYSQWQKESHLVDFEVRCDYNVNHRTGKVEVESGSLSIQSDASFFNDWFVGCSEGVRSHFLPNRLHVNNNTGDVTLVQSIYLTGKIDNCGEYLKLELYNSPGI